MEARSASTLSLAELTELCNSAFTGYIGNPVSHTPESLAEWCTTSYVSLPLSYVFVLPEEEDNESTTTTKPKSVPVGFALIAVRPHGDKPTHARLAAMGIAFAFQERKLGGKALAMVTAGERERGVEVLELECIRENVRGVRLYERAGFVIVRELVGWDRDPVVGDDASARGEEGEEGRVPLAQLKECTVEEVDAIVKTSAAEDLPWQAWGFVDSPTPQRAFSLNDEAYCVIAEPADKDSKDSKDEAIKVTCLIVKPEHRAKGASLTLARAMDARFPGRKWTVKGVYPREYGVRLGREMGFKETEMAQYQMRLRLR